MSDLQIGLILIGIVLILAVLVFNWWQDRRLHKAMQKHFPGHETDPLMSDPYPVSSGLRLEPAFTDNTQPDNAVSQPAISQLDDTDEVDPTTEVVIDINFVQPIDSIQLFEALKSLPQACVKPVRLFAETDNGIHRSKLHAGESYVSVQLAVLLANRSGPLTDIEWSKLWAFAQSVADSLDGSIEGPEYKQVVAQAQALDNTCANLDAQVGVVLQLVQAQPVNSLLDIFENAGFVQQESNFVYPSHVQAAFFTVLFNGVSLANTPQANVSRIDFVLDVPNSPPNEQAFSRMANVARSMAAELGATLLDDNNDPLPDHADHAIDQQLADLYQSLEQAGYPAGEARTMRVFS